MTKQEYKEKCMRYGMIYLGAWDGKHWALLEKVNGLPYHGGVLYEII